MHALLWLSSHRVKRVFSKGKLLFGTAAVSLLLTPFVPESIRPALLGTAILIPVATVGFYYSQLIGMLVGVAAVTERDHNMARNVLSILHQRDEISQLLTVVGALHCKGIKEALVEDGFVEEYHSPANLDGMFIDLPWAKSVDDFQGVVDFSFLRMKTKKSKIPGAKAS